MDRGARRGAAHAGDAGDAFVMWAKVPRTADAAAASNRPAPYNAIGRITRREAATRDVVFDPSHLLP
jgi:hypothetical protein